MRVYVYYSIVIVGRVVIVVLLIRMGIVIVFVEGAVWFADRAQSKSLMGPTSANRGREGKLRGNLRVVARSGTMKALHPNPLVLVLVLHLHRRVC